MRFRNSVSVLATVVGVSVGLAAEARLEDRLQQQLDNSIERLFANISPQDAAQGAVVASPSRENPHYFKHWVRDAGIVMESVFVSRNLPEYAKYQDRVTQEAINFVNFSIQNQNSKAWGGLGEPLFWADGSPYNENWGRPQNDGPALRALAAIKLAYQLIAAGEVDFVKSRMYDSRLPSQSLIKRDLEYVAHQWRVASFDLWEEVRGLHFFTLMVQRRALIDGAALADLLDDGGAAQFYREQANRIGDYLLGFWDSGRKLIATTLFRDAGIDYKNSQIDASVIVGVLHGATDELFSIDSEAVITTFDQHVETFRRIYSINQRFPDLGPAIGRYPEDTYDGYHVGKIGNPWVLLTSYFAEYSYRLASVIEANQGFVISKMTQDFYSKLAPELRRFEMASGQYLVKDPRLVAKVVSGLRLKGDNFLARVLFHQNPDLSLSEQMNRESGYMQGAANLTWNYATFIRAMMARRGDTAGF